MSGAAPRPGFARAAWIVARKDLRIEGRTLESLSAMTLFALVVLVVFNFAFDLSTVRAMGAARLVPGVLWVTVAFSAIVGFTRSFQIERRRDSLAGLILAPVDRGAIFAGKAAASFALLTILELILLPLSAVLFDFDLIAAGGPLALVVLVHSIGLVELGTLFGAVASKTGRGEALLATLLLPAATPIFLSAVRCTATVLSGAPISTERSWMLVTVGFDLLYGFVGLLTFEFVLED